jgi:hypothetical protein
MVLRCIELVARERVLGLHPLEIRDVPPPRASGRAARRGARRETAHTSLGRAPETAGTPRRCRTARGSSPSPRELACVSDERAAHIGRGCRRGRRALDLTWRKRRLDELGDTRRPHRRNKNDIRAARASRCNGVRTQSPPSGSRKMLILTVRLFSSTAVSGQSRSISTALLGAWP